MLRPFSSSRRISEPMRPTTSCIWRRCSTQIAYEQTLLLKHDLELLKLSLLFGEAVARKLERRGALTRGGFEVNPLGLQLTELIDGEDLSQLVGARGQVLVLAGTIDLALEGLELTRNLTIDVTGTGKVLVPCS